EYHTSADNLEFVTPAALEESLRTVSAVVEILERNRVYQSTNPFCEPALGRRGLYRSTGGAGIGDENLARLWIMNLADGQHSLLDIVERSKIDFATIDRCATELAESGLLVAAAPPGRARSTSQASHDLGRNVHVLSVNQK